MEKDIKYMYLACREKLSERINFSFTYNQSFNARVEALSKSTYFPLPFVIMFIGLNSKLKVIYQNATLYALSSCVFIFLKNLLCFIDFPVTGEFNMRYRRHIRKRKLSVLVLYIIIILI